jgi:glutathione S-transferase
LQDNELTIGESAAIVAYLARRYGGNGNALIPRTPSATPSGSNGVSSS